jgi:hypothetical protein
MQHSGLGLSGKFDALRCTGDPSPHITIQIDSISLGSPAQKASLPNRRRGKKARGTCGAAPGRALHVVAASREGIRGNHAVEEYFFLDIPFCALDHISHIYLCRFVNGSSVASVVRLVVATCADAADTTCRLSRLVRNRSGVRCTVGFGLRYRALVSGNDKS